MKCELAHERIVTGAYGELPDDQAHELDRHLAECAGCRQEREQLLAMKVLADALPVGPILIGGSRPAHILTPSVTARGIVNMTAVAVVEAQAAASGSSAP